LSIGKLASWAFNSARGGYRESAVTSIVSLDMMNDARGENPDSKVLGKNYRAQYGLAHLVVRKTKRRNLERRQ
jgi:hypothetical protein